MEGRSEISSPLFIKPFPRWDNRTTLRGTRKTRKLLVLWESSAVVLRNMMKRCGFDFQIQRRKTNRNMHCPQLQSIKLKFCRSLNLSLIRQQVFTLQGFHRSQRRLCILCVFMDRCARLWATKQQRAFPQIRFLRWDIEFLLRSILTPQILISLFLRIFLRKR